MINKKKQLIDLLNQGTLYGITASTCYQEKNVDVVEKLLNSGVKIIQYREKHMPRGDMLEELYEIRELTQRHNGILIVNDDPELCQAVGADGVHIGQEDGDVREIRKYLGNNKIIGLSTHCPEHANTAMELPIDYIGVGPAFKTKTKPNKKVAGLDYVKYVAQLRSLPGVAIGGIEMGNVEQVLKAGMRSVCMIQGVYREMGNFEAVVGRVLQKIEDYPLSNLK